MTQAGEAVASRRKIGRRRVLLRGVLVHGPAQMTIPCAISDLSGDGARVALEAAEAIAPPFLLLDMTNGVGWAAHQAWRDGATFGLNLSRRFDAANPAAGDPPVLHRLWVESVRKGSPGS